MKLTNIKCQNAKPKEKVYKLFDGRGLYLEVRPNGKRYWRLKYRHLGRERLMGLGVYPEITLASAREKCLEARRLIDQNIDPITARQEEERELIHKHENSFEALARQWHENFKEKWTEKHAETVIRRLEMDVFPAIGSMPIADIKPIHIIDTLKKVQSRGAYV